MATKKLAKAVPSVQSDLNPKPSRKKQNSAEKRLATITEAEKWKAVEKLAGIARGSALILGNLWEDLDDLRWQQVASGLSEVLREYADEVDVICFQSAGDLAHSVYPDLLAAVLKKEIVRLRKRA